MRTAPETLICLDSESFEVAPMVRELFPAAERQTILDMLGRSLVTLTQLQQC